MSYVPLEYLRHILIEADYLIQHSHSLVEIRMIRIDQHILSFRHDDGGYQ